MIIAAVAAIFEGVTSETKGKWINYGAVLSAQPKRNQLHLPAGKAYISPNGMGIVAGIIFISHCC